MARLRAVVLAAGRGIRMGGETPKTLLPLDGAGALLDHILEGLSGAGLTDLVVVTGFKPHLVQEHVDRRWQGDVQYVRNTRFASWGNFHSVRVAVDQSPGADLLVVNSDVVVAPSVYREMLASAGDLVLAVQQRYDLDDEDMKVRLDGRRVRAIGKRLPRSLAQAEFCGVSLLRPQAARSYADVAGSLEWTGETGIYYEDVYERILGRTDARWIPVDQGAYAEVDEPGDVPAAVEVIHRVRPVEPAG